MALIANRQWAKNVPIDAQGGVPVVLYGPSGAALFPAAAALADGTANPTAPSVAAHLELWNTATWDRAKDVSAANAQGAGTGIIATGIMGRDGVAGVYRRLGANPSGDLMVQQRHATAWVSATAAAGAGVTLTIPAAGAGIFNYLVYLQVVAFAAALLTAAATPVLVTTTGMNGTPTFSFPAAATPQGQIAGEQKYEGQTPAQGSAANTALTVVCPATTNVIWRVNAAYFTA